MYLYNKLTIFKIKMQLIWPRQTVCAHVANQTELCMKCATLFIINIIKNNERAHVYFIQCKLQGVRMFLSWGRDAESDTLI